jgi:2-haloacid dehalogenase
MEKYADLRWDLVLSAEIFGRYKPDRETYLGAFGMLDLAPQQVMMVASHNFDLAAAQKLGLRTAFVLRPTESGPTQSHDLKPEGEWDIVSRSLEEIADQLGV